MTKEQIKAVQRRIGTEADGLWGPKSQAAVEKHLRALMPVPHPWPKTGQAALTAFYGKPGDEKQLVTLSVEGIGLKYESREVKTLRCHRKVADSLKRVLIRVAERGYVSILAEYAGVYANRAMRGGSTPSLHARGAAIDLAPDDNGLNTHWPKAAAMPLDVMEEFAREGWLPAGAFWNRDAMHFQATQ